MFIFARNFFWRKVNLLKQYLIPFTGLSLGDHDYQFEITDEFFEHFEYSEIKNTDIDVKVILNKQSAMMILDFTIQGKVDFICDRCQEPYTQVLNGKERLIFKFSDDQSQSDDEIIILAVSENKIDLSQHIFEYISLMFPYKRMHPEDENGNSMCDVSMINQLKSFEKKQQIDPRWEALKDISFKE